MGELRWLATVSRPDICARLAQLTLKVNDLQGSDIYRINALIKTVKMERPRAVLKCASSSFPLFPACAKMVGGCVSAEMVALFSTLRVVFAEMVYFAFGLRYMLISLYYCLYCSFSWVFSNVRIGSPMG